MLGKKRGIRWGGGARFARPLSRRALRGDLSRKGRGESSGACGGFPARGEVNARVRAAVFPAREEVNARVRPVTPGESGRVTLHLSA